MSNMDYAITLPQVMPMAGIGAGDAAKLAMKSAGVNPEDPMGVNVLTNRVMKSLISQGVEADEGLVRQLALQALKSQTGTGLVQKATDPVISPWYKTGVTLQ